MRAASPERRAAYPRELHPPKGLVWLIFWEGLRTTLLFRAAYSYAPLPSLFRSILPVLSFPVGERHISIPLASKPIAVVTKGSTSLAATVCSTRCSSIPMRPPPPGVKTARPGSSGDPSASSPRCRATATATNPLLLFPLFFLSEWGRVRINGRTNFIFDGPRSPTEPALTSSELNKVT